MRLKPFSIAGEALQFAMRRYETVLERAVLPLALLLIFNMTAAFGYLSVANDRIITFRDVANAGASWAQVAHLAGGAAVNGLMSGSQPIWTIYGASLLVNAILVASFIAPLIRYAGLGERPARGLISVPFGGSQIRFLLAGALSTLIFLIVVYAPISLATISIISFISQAMTIPFANFPDPESLHSIDVIAGAKAFGIRWLGQHQVWSAWGLGIGAVVAALLFFHVRPRAEDRTAGIGWLGRMLGAAAGVALYLAVVVALYVGAMHLLARLLLWLGLPPLSAVATPDGISIVVFSAAVFAFAGFFGLRLFPYAGVAVCERGLAFNGALRVTRRYDVLRLAFAFMLLGFILYGAQFLLVWLGVGAAYAGIAHIAAAVESYVRLLSGPEGGDWVFPFFGWLWAVMGILITILWTAFTYGVAAGLWGRLYRESAGR